MDKHGLVLGGGCIVQGMAVIIKLVLFLPSTQHTRRGRAEKVVMKLRIVWSQSFSIPERILVAAD